MVVGISILSSHGQQFRCGYGLGLGPQAAPDLALRRNTRVSLFNAFPLRVIEKEMFQGADIIRIVIVMERYYPANDESRLL